MNTDHTLEEVGQFSVTRERIRQIEAKALRKLKHPSGSRKRRSFLDNKRPVETSRVVPISIPATQQGSLPMKRLATGLVVVFALSGLFAGEAQAKGCLKGAVVGAVAGHLAHHHAVLGAITGCVVGHHLAHKHDHDHDHDHDAPKPHNGASGQY